MDIIDHEVVAGVSRREVVDRYARLIVVLFADDGELHLIPLSACCCTCSLGYLSGKELSDIGPLASFVPSLHIESEDRVLCISV